MSFSKTFEMFRDKPRVVINDMYIGDEGAHELAVFLTEHSRVQILQIKSNNISGAGFIQIFNALQKNPTIKQIIAQYNDLGKNDYEQWHDALGSLLSRSSKLQRLNISNNKISSQGFSRIIYPLCESKSLKLLELRYNSVSSEELSRFINELKNAHNNILLYVEVAGNKISKQILESLQNYLKGNRKNNPISKDKLLMAGGFHENKTAQPSRSQNNFNRTNAIDDLSKQNILKHLGTILDQNRRDSAEMKVRLENQLMELQRKQKLDGNQLNQLDSKCNQTIIQNRNLKFELDRTVSEYQQMQRDQQYHLRIHQDKLRQANKQLQELENKYEELQSRMNKEHELKMKEISRDWQGRLRNVEQKIRTTQNQNSLLQNQIRKHLQKRQRLRIQCLEQENIVRNRIEEQETQRYNFKLTSLESRLQEVQQTRQKYLHRNKDIVYQLEKCDCENNREISILEEQLNELRRKQDQFSLKNKEFVGRNQRIKNQIQMKQMSVEKLEEQINRFNQEIGLKKSHNREQIDKIIADNDYDKSRREQQKNSQIQKMTELETLLRNSQLENSKLRQQYGILAQRLQISLGKAVQDVFSDNNLH